MTDAASKSVKIFLVDDHIMVCEGLAMVLKQAGFVVCGQAQSIHEAVSHPALASARLAVVDLTLGDEDGVELIKVFLKRGLPSLVYSMHEGSNVVQRAFVAGAAGYVTKREVASCLVDAVKTVLSGVRYVSPRAGLGLAVRPVADVLSGLKAELSEQQLRIFSFLGEGLNSEEIAKRLGVSPRTVESYCARMIEKLPVSGMKELRRMAIADRHKSRAG